MWYEGLLGLNFWQVGVLTLISTHITIVGVTVYLHRFSAHRALEMHPALQHFFRFWLWLTTGMNTKEWTSIHRKHHAAVETPEDPHSPAVLGLHKVFWEGVELYRLGRTDEIRAKYGRGTPEDWLELKVYTPRSQLGIFLLMGLDLLLFGPIGLTVWAAQMIWIPIFAAGIINGVGHHTGYRNFESPDASTNVSPWGIIIGGEELHNNHHTYPSSAKMSVKWFEFDIGWMWITIFSWFGLAKAKRLPPVAHHEPEKRDIDLDTTMAVINNRFHVMAQFGATVVAPLAEQERAVGTGGSKELFRRAKLLLCREESLLDEETRKTRSRLLAQSDVLNVIYQSRLELQELWENRTASKDELLSCLHDWCQKAEASGIRALEEFSLRLRSYTMGPEPA
ncbi:MAG: stearoyl-CoA desaturase (delta-9 desaturase) [Gammaproteobacteria bacterium]|jgi:stearoyl-CoA desaturase (delta-9 desaturase)